MDKKKRKRKTKGKSKPYFGRETQAAIIEFQDIEKEVVKYKNVLSILKGESAIVDCDNLPPGFGKFDVEHCGAVIEALKRKQVDLYCNIIQPSFDKLGENLIFIHNFTSLYDSYEDLKSDCISFLYQSIPKYDREKATRAFSYFNVIAKNFLIIRSKSRASKIKKNVSLDDQDSISADDMETVIEFYTVPSPDDIMEIGEFGKDIELMLLEIKKKVKNENEEKCIDAIISIFKSMDSLDFLNKRAIFQYIREISGLSPKQLTTTMSSLKRHYKELKELLV